MIEDKDLKLIHRKFDGDLNAAELVYVDDLLNSSEELRASLASLERLNRALQAARPEQPPSGLQAAIMSQIQPKPEPESRFRPAAVFAMAASLVLAVTILLQDVSEEAIQNVAGTLVSADVVNNQQNEGPDLVAQLSTKWEADNLILHIEPSPPADTTVVLYFPNQTLNLVSGAKLMGSEGKALLIGDGDSSVAVHFQQKLPAQEEQSITVAFIRDGREIAESTLTIENPEYVSF